MRQPASNHAAPKAGHAASSNPPTSAPLTQFTLVASKVMIGSHHCGKNVEVTFTSSNVRWYPGEGYLLPDGTYSLTSVPIQSVTKVEVDKTQGGIAIWSMFEPPYETSGKFLPFCAHTEPQSSIYFEYNADDFEREDRPRTKWPSEIIQVAPQLRPLTTFVNAGKISGRPRGPVRKQQVVPKEMRGPNATSTHGQRQTQAAAGGSSASASAASRKRPQREPDQARISDYADRGGTIDRGRGGESAFAASARASAWASDAAGAPPGEWPSTAAAQVRRSQRPRRSSSSGGGMYEPADGADMTDVVWVYPALGEKDAVTLTHEELRRLHDRDFLNDSLIDYQLKVIAARLPEEQRRRCHFFNTFFFKRLMIATRKLRGAKLRDLDSMRECYRQVARWTKGVNLFDKDYVFVPINEHLHWSLVVLYKPGAWAGAELARREGDEAKRKEKEEEIARRAEAAATAEKAREAAEEAAARRKMEEGEEEEEVIEAVDTDDDVADDVEDAETDDDADAVRLLNEHPSDGGGSGYPIQAADEFEDDPMEVEGGGRARSRRHDLNRPSDDEDGDDDVEEEEADVEAEAGSMHARALRGTMEGGGGPKRLSNAELIGDDDDDDDDDDDFAGGASSNPPPTTRAGRADAAVIDVDDDDDDDAAAAAAPGAPSEPPCREPCLVYVDSMNGAKPNAFLRLKAYLSLEYEEKVVAPGKARQSPPGPAAEAGVETGAAGSGGASAGAATAGEGAPAREEGGEPPLCCSQDSAKSSDVEVTGERRAHAESGSGGDADDGGGGGTPYGSSGGGLSHHSAAANILATARRGGGNASGGDSSGGSGSRSAASAEEAHLFERCSELKIEVEHQHNGIDCGLFMLKYIEQIATHAPDFLKQVKCRPRPNKPSPALRTFDTTWHLHYPEMSFGTDVIDQMRTELFFEIKKGGADQRGGGGGGDVSTKRARAAR